MERSRETVRRLMFLLATVVAGQVPAQDAPQPGYDARLADGTMIAAEPIRDWHDVNATPRIGNHAIFDSAKPVEWIVREGPPANEPPHAFVEFTGGDRMPGEVVGFSTGAETPYRRLPAHLIVAPAAALRRPGTEFDPPVRVEAGHVRRVVWQPSGGETAAPNTAVFRDGRRLPFRALRWANGAVTLLLEAGVQTVPFSELAEVRLTDGDAWEAFLDHAASVLPDGEGRLIQIETVDGLVALVSTQRLRPESHGDNRRLDHWYQTVQPAWSLDPFWVRFSSVAAWRIFPPERVPLTLLEPQVTRTEVVLSTARRPRVNQAVTGGPLTDGAALFGWGFGVHAPTELTLALPESAVGFRSRYGLDPSVGPGGCARTGIDLKTGETWRELYRSDVLIGAAESRDAGRMSLPNEPPAARELRLVADPVYDERPAGADPFDIRDAVSWFGPELELDPASVKAELRRRAVARLPGLAGWEVDATTAETAAVTVRWDERDWEDPRYRNVAAVGAGHVTLRRRVRIGDEDRYLAVYAHCPHDDFRPARIQARIDGTVLGELPVPTEHGRREPEPLLFPVHAFVGQTVVAEVIQLPGAIDEPKPAAIDWRGAELASHRPGLRMLFEDDGTLADALVRETGGAEVDPSERQTGAASLRIGPPGGGAAEIGGWNFPIAEDAELGEYRYLRFAWKAAGRGPVAVAIGHDRQIGPGDGTAVAPRRVRRRASRSDDRGAKNGYRYRAGPGGDADADVSPSIKLDGEPPVEWRVVQRDLYGDFGPFTVTGLGLTTRDGLLRLDGVYLARSQDQFRFIEEEFAGPPVPLPGTEPNVTLRTNDPRTFATLIAEVAPGFGLSGQGGELQLLEEHRGRKTVLRTHPEGSDAKQAARLTAAIDLAGKTRSRLKLAVSHYGTKEDDQKDWDLQVFANGREILSRRIDRGATNDGWLDLTADLSEFDGRPVRIELRHKTNGSDHEYGYWHDVRIVTE